MATVNLIQVSKQYGSEVILHEVDLSIEKGEFVALVGPSGSGKSSLLRLVSGLDRVSQGQILINNQCVNALSPEKRDMAMVFQQYALYPHMTVFQNMAYGLKMRGFKKDVIEQRVRDVAELLQLTPCLEKKPSLISGGQRQRVAMGRALVRQPSVFLFDEPLSNLDVNLRTDMRHEIKKLHQQLKTTSLYVTHDQTEAMTLATRIVVLNHGRVEQIGTPQALYQTPETVFVGGFIGQYPMNFLKATADKHQQRLLCEVGFTLPWPNTQMPLTDGQSLLIGIRPEHWRVESSLQETSIATKVAFVDDLGADLIILVHTQQGDAQLTVRLPSGSPIIDDSLFLGIDKRKALVFCEQTGRRLGGYDA